MFKDRFIGGSMDGEERPTSEKTLAGTPLRDTDTGHEYHRAPELDTTDVRAWQYVPYKHRPEGEPRRPILRRAKKGLTLAAVRSFVQDAIEEGYDENTRVEAASDFHLRLRRIEVHGDK